MHFPTGYWFGLTLKTKYLLHLRGRRKSEGDPEDELGVSLELFALPSESLAPNSPGGNGKVAIVAPNKEVTGGLLRWLSRQTPLPASLSSSTKPHTVVGENQLLRVVV